MRISAPRLLAALLSTALTAMQAAGFRRSFYDGRRPISFRTGRPDAVLLSAQALEPSSAASPGKNGASPVEPGG